MNNSAEVRTAARQLSQSVNQSVSQTAAGGDTR